MTAFEKGDQVLVTVFATWRGHSFNLSVTGTVDRVLTPIDEYSDPDYWVWLDMPDIGKTRERVEHRLLTHL